MVVEEKQSDIVEQTWDGLRKTQKVKAFQSHVLCFQATQVRRNSIGF
jgi:hypothetical protein